MAETNINKQLNESLEQYYRRLAKQADQRLVRLEKLAAQGDPGYQGVLSWAYARAEYDISHKWGGSSTKPRFNTKPPEDVNALKAKINDIQSFLEDQTSTKAGIKASYKKKADTFNENHGTNLKWDDWAEYLDRFGVSLYDKYGSTVMNRVIKTVQSMANNNPDQFGSAEKLHHLALLRKNGGYKFNYIKVDGTDGGYDKLVDNALHEIFRKRKDIEDIYKLLVGR